MPRRRGKPVPADQDSRLRQCGMIRIWVEPWSMEFVELWEGEEALSEGWVELDAILLTWLGQRAFDAPSQSVLRPRFDAIQASCRANVTFAIDVIDSIIARASNLDRRVEWRGMSSKLRKRKDPDAEPES